MPSEPSSLLIHASTVSVSGRAILLRGPSGAGKSDLALRLLAMSPSFLSAGAQAQLVADDQTVICRRHDILWASSPETISGRLEVRGVGIITCPAVPEAKVSLVVDLVAAGEPIERLPDQMVWESLGVRVPRVRLSSFEASAACKVLAALAIARKRDEDGQDAACT